jgi:vacuolar-type H+-ATPase subunit E/Vma4
VITKEIREFQLKDAKNILQNLESIQKLIKENKTARVQQCSEKLYSRALMRAPKSQSLDQTTNFC